MAGTAKIISDNPIHSGFLNIFLRNLSVWGIPRTREVVLTKQVVAGLVYSSRSNKVWLTRQFRAPVMGFVTGLVSGYVESGEGPETAMIRELAEKTGISGAGVTRISSFYSSPGWTNEYNHLYFCEVLEDPDCAKIHGVESEGESIELVSVLAGDFIYDATHGNLDSAKLAIAGLWFAANAERIGVR